jgi:hypothetical protein
LIGKKAASKIIKPTMRSRIGFTSRGGVNSILTDVMFRRAYVAPPMITRIFVTMTALSE